LAVALKFSDQNVRALVRKNLSKRAAHLLEYEIDLLGQTPTHTIVESKQRIVSVIRRLAKQESIPIPRGGRTAP